jgi:hypothetical protein
MDFGTFFCAPVDDDEEAQLNRILRLAATRINMARQAQGACDCTLSATASEYLKYLNCVLAVAFYNCKCTNLVVTVEEKKMYMEAAMADLELIQKGQIELCDGETGADFPWTGWAEQGWTEATQVEIIVNDILKNS